MRLFSELRRRNVLRMAVLYLFAGRPPGSRSGEGQVA